MKVEIYSFFSGVGILDLGFSDIGFDIVSVNEINEKFLDAYIFSRKNHLIDLVPKYGYNNINIRNYLDDNEWNHLCPEYKNTAQTLVGFIGGPPCPDFSTAGNNRGAKGINGQLTGVYIDLIIKREPDFFVFENVRGLYATKKHKIYYDYLKRKLYRAGYSLFDSIENALWYGAPQDRERLILVGFKRKRFGKRIRFKIGANRIYTMKEISQCNWPKETPFCEASVLSVPNHIIKELTAQYWFLQNDVLHHPNGHDCFRIKNKVKYYTIPEGCIRGKSFKRLHRWRYSPTAAYGNNEVHLHPYFPRRLSVAEVLAIQSLPKNFILPENMSLSEKFKMIGNGVPYLLSKGIALDIRQWFRENGYIM